MDRRTLLLLALALAVGAAGCASKRRLAFEQAASELPRAQAEARRLGLPLTGADLRPNPPVPPDQNAAEPIRRAIAELQKAEAKDRGWEEALSEAVRQPRPETIGEARRALEALARALRAAEEAAAMPAVDFGRNWDQEPAYAINFPELAQIKNLVKALAMRGAFRAAAGEPADASVRDFEAAFRLARHAGADPVLIAGLVQVACEATVVRSMEQAATVRPKDRALLEALRRVAAGAAEIRPDLPRHLRGEVLLGLSGARNLRRLAEDARGANADVEGTLKQVDELLPDGIPPDVAQKAYEARVLQAWIGAFRQPEALRDPLRAGRVLDEMEKRHTDPKDPTMALNRIVFPVFSAAADAYARRDAYLAAFQGLMGALRFRAANGRWPKDLAEADAQGTDPFDGQPLRYKAEGDSARVYSVGPDRRDDGGAEG
ncbi:MAG: hypothetical protein ACK41F_13920, partial [Fimbriimonadaceae bacterium]